MFFTAARGGLALGVLWGVPEDCPKSVQLSVLPSALPSETFGTFSSYAPDVADGESKDLSHDTMRCLARAMRSSDRPAGYGEVPAFFAFVTEFIANDLCALSTKDPTVSEGTIINRRAEVLKLACVYGKPNEGSKLREGLLTAMRDPMDRAKFAMGPMSGIPCVKQVNARRFRADLQRVGNLPGVERDLIPLVRNAPNLEPLKSYYFDASGAPVQPRALIADRRNDANLGVAQVHLMMLALHNKIVETADQDGLGTQDREQLFEWAKDHTKTIYQWLIINVFLPAFCNAEVLSDVLAFEAPMYRQLLGRGAGADAYGAPIPVEFVAANLPALHTLSQGTYDWNRRFGRDPGAKKLSYHDLCTMKQDGTQTPPNAALNTPAHLAPEMERLLNIGDEWHADRNLPLLSSVLPDAKANDIEGCLWLAQQLDVASGQALCNAFSEAGITVTPLSKEDIRASSLGDALEQHGLLDQTPLWLYLLVEAEICEAGQTLGPLGSRIMAETLAGLIIHDPNSFWHRAGSDDRGRWEPRDGVMIDGCAIDSFPALAAATGFV